MTNPRRTTRKKHVPVRTCVICHERSDKRSMTRLVRTDKGIIVDPTGKLEGRGAYICEKPSCWEQAAHTNRLANALKMTFTEADRQYLIQAIANHEPG
jgi:predicted RNA-binding protein YlxR (DUF448 family)